MSSTTGAAMFHVRNSSGIAIPGAKIYTSINRMTWYYRGYTDGVGTLSVPNLPQGTNYYMVSLTGYNIANGSMNIIADVMIDVNVTLIKSLSAMSVGSLTVVSEPIGATIYIDDAIQTSLTPATVIDVPVGDHVLVLTKNGYNDYIIPVNVVGGQIITVGGQSNYVSANLIPTR